MSTSPSIWDGSKSKHLHHQQRGLRFWKNSCEPWKNLTKSIKTVTRSILYMQNTFRKENKCSFNRDDFSKALSRRGALRHLITIQISSNRYFVFIGFSTQHTMETFCNEKLIMRGFNMQFYPERKQPQREGLPNISFLDVPPQDPCADPYRIPQWICRSKRHRLLP